MRLSALQMSPPHSYTHVVLSVQLCRDNEKIISTFSPLVLCGPEHLMPFLLSALLFLRCLAGSGRDDAQWKERDFTSS